MNNEEFLSKLAALRKLQGLNSPAPTVSPSVSDQRIKQMETSPEIQMRELEISEPEVMRVLATEGQEHSEDAPITQTDHVEAQKAALERLKNRENQKMNFRGGFLEQNRVYDNE